MSAYHVIVKHQLFRAGPRRQSFVFHGDRQQVEERARREFPDAVAITIAPFGERPDSTTATQENRT